MRERGGWKSNGEGARERESVRVGWGEEVNTLNTEYRSS